MERLSVVAYCERWNSFDRRPGRIISESKARKLDSQGDPYIVTLGDAVEVRTLVSVNWSLSSLGVWFLDEAGRRNLKYSFSRVDPQELFLDEVTVWAYPDAVEGDLSSASKVTNVRYQQDGGLQFGADHQVRHARSAGRECHIQCVIPRGYCATLWSSCRIQVLVPS